MGKMKQYLEDLTCDRCSTFIEHKDYILYDGDLILHNAIICEECYNSDK